MPELLRIHPDEVRPMDMVDEGRFVRSLTLRYDAWLVQLEVGPCHLEEIDVRTATGTGVLTVPRWGDMDTVIHKVEDQVVVVRGMTPSPYRPTEGAPPPTDGAWDPSGSRRPT